MQIVLFYIKKQIDRPRTDWSRMMRSERPHYPVLSPTSSGGRANRNGPSLPCGYIYLLFARWISVIEVCYLFRFICSRCFNLFSVIRTNHKQLNLNGFLLTNYKQLNLIGLAYDISVLFVIFIIFADRQEPLSFQMAFILRRMAWQKKYKFILLQVF